MEQFIKTKDRLINLREVSEITAHFREDQPIIIFKRKGEGRDIQLIYELENKRSYDLKLIIGGIKSEISLIELQYA